MNLRNNNLLNIIWRDLTGVIGILFMMLFIIALIMINPIGKEIDEANVTFKGSIVVEMFWPDDYASDVDMWVQAPGDIPVGYIPGHRNGKFFGYLRDDRGSFNDFSNRNFEFAATRGRPLGEYVVNAHLFAFRTWSHNPALQHEDGKGPTASPDEMPIEVRFKVTMLDESFNREVLIQTKVLLERGFQEITAVRFTLKQDAAGRIVMDQGSINSINKSLRAQSGATEYEGEGGGYE